MLGSQYAGDILGNKEQRVFFTYDAEVFMKELTSGVLNSARGATGTPALAGWTTNDPMHVRHLAARH